MQSEAQSIEDTHTNKQNNIFCTSCAVAYVRWEHILLYKHILLYSLLYQGGKEPNTIIKDNYSFCACAHAYACVMGSFSLSLCLFIIWQAPWAGKMNQILCSEWLSDGAILPTQDTGFALDWKFIMLGTLTLSQSINRQKKNKANIQPSWPHAWSITHICCSDNHTWLRVYVARPKPFN